MTAPRSDPAPSFAGPAAAFGILAELGVLRAVLDADDGRAYFLGRPIELLCGFRVWTGVPCPMCGITRAVAFALRGDFQHALHLNAAAPIAVLGLLLLSLGLLVGWAVTAVAGPRRGRRFAAALRRGTWLYSAAGLALWLAAVTGRAAEALSMR